MEIHCDEPEQNEQVTQKTITEAVDTEFPIFDKGLPVDNRGAPDPLYVIRNNLLPTEFQNGAQTRPENLPEQDPEMTRMEIIQFLLPYLVIILLAAGVSYQVVDILKPVQVERTDQQRIEAFLKEYMRSKGLSLELINNKNFWKILFKELTKDEFKGTEKDFKRILLAFKEMPKDKFEKLLDKLLDKTKK